MRTQREFRDYAAQCIEAAKAASRSDRTLYLDMARAWQRLAERAQLEDDLARPTR